jgi:hypothetical protein
MQHTYFAEAYGGEALMTGEEIPVVFDLIFPSFGPFDSRSVVPTLIDLAQYLFGVFQAFASLYG